MAIQTWFTQPANSFASFYYLDTTSRNMVRIRLELNRGDHGNPVIISRANRYVGFVAPTSTTVFDYASQYWTVNGNGEIVYTKGGTTETLSNVAQAGWKVIDFSTGSSAANVHHGNRVTTDPRLPFASPYIAITPEVLRDIAAAYIVAAGSTNICAYNASERDLVKALVGIYRP